MRQGFRGGRAQLFPGLQGDVFLQDQDAALHQKARIQARHDCTVPPAWCSSTLARPAWLLELVDSGPDVPQPGPLPGHEGAERRLLLLFYAGGVCPGPHPVDMLLLPTQDKLPSL